MNKSIKDNIIAGLKSLSCAELEDVAREVKLHRVAMLKERCTRKLNFLTVEELKEIDTIITKVVSIQGN